ncbi:MULTISPECIES: DapH/DapD/GlmU-related protein [unclassified Rhodococcus (in: high G+C Gram-positive bacteria)]|uniref:acyltransferase n=1 Tax=unclassified Rhodococcus (in: high G+C Gram-positive bacteria) TaxID=192944 RepID=UPI00163B09A7|nr:MULTISPECIES: acyltransferase [unclassified Rhodococcus (in: high G+C Gram-positive bacteria)]MBC2642715.1 acyltransferase [Rhodococcus sp. 3A]MBC2892543.1 acyltransferase [Rhodococcus sp. 4CII]
MSRFDRSVISLGDNVVLCSRSQDTALGVTTPVILRTLLPNALLSVGDDVGVSGAVVCAARSVVIGNSVLIGSGAIICDTDFHAPRMSDGRRYAPLPDPAESDGVVIGDECFIGARAMILKGVKVGAGSVVGAGSIVTKSVAPGSIVAGNPARVVGAVVDS